jgi:hypothetical protein
MEGARRGNAAVTGGRSDSRPATTTAEATMIKVKTFATPIQIFATIKELQELDERVTQFLNDEDAATVYSVSDTTTTGDKGETIGLIRTVAYSTAAERA